MLGRGTYQEVLRLLGEGVVVDGLALRDSRSERIFAIEVPDGDYVMASRSFKQVLVNLNKDSKM